MQTKGRLGHLVLLVVLVVCAIAGAVQGREHAPDFADHDPGAIKASGKGPDANWIDFVTGLEPPAYQEGRIFWDKDNGCLAIGVVYEDVAPGALGYVVVSGVGYVKMASTEVATSGGLLLVDDGEVGKAMSATTIPPTTQTEHNKELGHCISTQSTQGGLVKAILHFN